MGQLTPARTDRRFSVESLFPTLFITAFGYGGYFIAKSLAHCIVFVNINNTEISGCQRPILHDAAQLHAKRRTTGAFPQLLLFL